MGFKVIIVGGGLSGLGLAHCLSKAGIDFVVLERSGTPVIQGGAALCIWPNNVRILDQLGLLKGAQEIDFGIKYKRNVRKDGSVIAKNNMLERVGVALGHPWMCFHRPELHRYLYEALPDHESRIMVSKEVTALETTAEGVRLTCQDGSVHEGSIVVGADGANSAIRRYMPRSQLDGNHAEPFTTSYRALYGCSSWTKDIDAGIMYELHSDKITGQVIPKGGIVAFVLYERLPTTTRGSTRYSEEEKQRFAENFGDVNLTETVKFKDIWSKTTWSHFAGLEEGVSGTWYGGRVVLVGDSAHKMTPNVGLGLNSGWQSAVILTNGLRRLLEKQPEPSTEAIAEAFKDYQATREKNAKDMSSISGLYTRVVTWANPIWKIMDQYILPYVGGDCALLDLLLIPLVAKQGNTLDFLDETHFKTGKTRWNKGQTTVSKDVEIVA